MTRGRPDYDNPDTIISINNTDPMSVLGGLGGIVSIDGSGRVLFADKFDNGLASWVLQATGAGFSPFAAYQYNANYFSGGGVLLSPVNDVSTSIMSRYWGGMPAGRYGLEMAFYLTTFSGGVDVQIDHEGASGVYYRPRFQIDPLTKTVKLLNSSGAFQDIHSWSFGAGIPEGWYTIKIAWDMNTGKYIRLIVGSIKYDVSNVGLLSIGGSTDYRIHAFIIGKGYTGKVSVVGLGYVLLSIDEQ